jgi:type IV secretory pathway VirB3-like protein
VDTRTIILYEMAGLVVLITAIMVVWGNLVFMLAVFAIYVWLRTLYVVVVIKRARSLLLSAAEDTLKKRRFFSRRGSSSDDS